MSRFKKAMKAISLNDVAISQQYRQMLDAVSWIASLSRYDRHPFSGLANMWI